MARPAPHLRRPSRRALRWLAWQLHRLHRQAVRHPRATLLAAGLLVAVTAAGLPRTRVHLSIRELADPALPSLAWSSAEEASFGAGYQLVLFFAPRPPRERLDAADLAAIRAWVTAERARNPEILRAASPFDAVRAERDATGRLRLVPALAADTPEALRALAAGPWGGLLTDREGRDVAVDFTLRAAPGGSRFGRFDPSVVAPIERRCRDELLAAHPGVALHLGGTAAFDHFALRGLARFQVLNAAVLVLLIVVMRVLFGTWRSGLLLAASILFAGLVVQGAMALAGVPMDLLSTGLFLMLSVAGVEDFVFLSHERLVHRTRWRAAFRRLLLPGFLTSATTIIGFGSLCTSELQLVRRFGFWGALGAGLEWAATFLVLPALLALAPRWRDWTEPARALGAGAWTRVAAWRLPRPVALAALSALALAAAASGHLTYADSPAGMFPAGHPFRAGLEYAEATRGWVGQLDLVFPEDASHADVERMASMLGKDPAVARVVDPASLQRDLTGGDPLALYELAAEREKVGGAAQTFTAADGRLRASVLLREADLLTLQGLRDRIAALFPAGDGFPAGDLVTYADVGSAVPRTLLFSLLTCLALVGLLVAGLFHALARPGAPWAVLASFWGPSLVLLALWGLRVPINFVSVSFASVLVGLTGDNAVQFACASGTGRAPLARGIARRAGAATLVVVLMGLGALTFLGSAFLPPRLLGLLLAGGLVAALVGDVSILGALVRPGRGEDR
ncbi:MAG: MMPL family transporter [Anaeromyxobacteraceae bacterium]